MKKLIIVSLIWFGMVGFSSCSDDTAYPEKTFFTTQFSVYECNDNYAGNAVATSFVSIGAEISIWSVDNSGDVPTYKLVEQIKTGEDGKATYKHNRPLFYYSVQKYSDSHQLMSNLVSPLSYERTLGNKFLVEGIFVSEEEVHNYQYNLPHLSDKYVPKVGNVKFRDLNDDNIIDVEDSISKVAVYNFSEKPTEEIVYIAVE